MCQKADGSCFLGQEGVLIMEFMQHETTIMSEVYFETLKELCRAMGMLTSGIVLLHDNAHPHTAACTQVLLSISTGSCLTTLLTDLISLRVTTTHLPT
jgi:hypothetical protein